LLCGDHGLVHCLELVFNYGFRSSRLFRNKMFVWDFLGMYCSWILDIITSIKLRFQRNLSNDTEHCNLGIFFME
jgi:hypothetical protein